MADLFLVGKACQNAVGQTGKVEVFWCASGSTGDPLTETTIEGSTLVDFLASGAQMTLQVEADARAKYLAASGVNIPATNVKKWGSIV